MEEKGDLLKQRFEKRQEARIKELQKKKADTVAKTNENETAEVFNKSFVQETDKIVEILASLEETGLNKSQRIEKFDELKRKIQDLQKFVTNSIMFLPSYDVRQAQENLQKLDNEVNEKREILMPRKKFTFKQRAKGNGGGETGNLSKNTKETDIKKTVTLDENEDAFGFHDCKDSDLILHSYESKKKDIKLSNLTNCSIKIFGCPSALHVNNLKNCKILCGPISRPAFVTNCLECKFSLACQQLRIHTTHNSVFNIHITGKAIIEDCSDLGFAPYNWKYTNIHDDFTTSGLNTAINKWNDIDDFNWLKFDEHSPNWHAVPEENRNSITED